MSWKITKTKTLAKRKEQRSKPSELVWAAFQADCALSDEQVALFKRYAALLEEWNSTRNLTALTGLSAVINQHFKDSLAARGFVGLSQICSMADIGPGAGFPSIPLKILFPHLRLLLIEVNHKKQEFLYEVIKELGLENVEVCSLDWRTFLRKTGEDIELFVTKAAFDEMELCRMFRTTSNYRDRQVIYWAAGAWECEPKVCHFVRRTETYLLGRKERRLVFLGPPVA